VAHRDRALSRVHGVVRLLLRSNFCHCVLGVRDADLTLAEAAVTNDKPPPETQNDRIEQLMHKLYRQQGELKQMLAKLIRILKADVE
jgi:hypothetical protein